MSLFRNALNSVGLIHQLALLSRPQFSSSIGLRYIKRWVAPTLKELRCRQKKLGPQPLDPRSSFLEWNIKSEIFAFSKRLNENFDLNMLQEAFTDCSFIVKEIQKQRDLGINQPDINMNDNTELTDVGKEIAEKCVHDFIKFSLPYVPTDGQQAISSYLLSQNTLSFIANNLGMKELVFSSEYPPSDEIMARSFLAVIGALKESSGDGKAIIFVRDFICTQLNQKDLMEIWEILDPEQMLKDICKTRNLADPEPRLIGECAKNSVLSAFHVGIYSNKQLIGKGFGEDIPTAVKTASLDTLRSLFAIQDNMKPFDFLMNIEKCKDSQKN